MPLKSRSRLLVVALSAFVFAVCQGSQASAQSERAAQTARPDKPATQIEQPASAASSMVEASPEEAAQERIEDDTKKLYQLALELRTEVGKTYKQSLSLDVLKKAGELEKLAKNLKSEMDREALAKKR